MNEVVTRRWIDALRTGGYKQGTGRLRPTRTTFCCLGVLCDLAVKNNVIPEATTSRADGINYSGSFSVPPGPVYMWSGAPTMVSKAALTYVRKKWQDQDTRLPKVDGVEGSLVSLNDSGWPFAAIADAIEYDLEHDDNGN